MSKTGIVFWVISVGLLITAIAFAVTGVALGATPEIPAEVRLGTSWSWNWSDNTNIDDLQLAASDEDVEGDSQRALYHDITTLDIETGGINTVIREWDGTGINVDKSNLSEDVRSRLSVDQIGDNLSITTENRLGINIGSNMWYETLIIQVPRGFEFEWVLLDTGAGRITVERIVANLVEITVGAGHIEVDVLEANALLIDIGAGHGSISDFKADVVNMHVGAGQLDVTGTIEERADLDCGIGEITFNVHGSQEEFGHSISVGIGEANFGNLSIAGLGRDSTGNQHLDKQIDINVGIGSVTVNFLN